MCIIKGIKIYNIYIYLGFKAFFLISKVSKASKDFKTGDSKGIYRQT